MKLIINFIQQFSKKDVPIMLGRWTINYCTKTTDYKIDYANHDNCGSCSSYNAYSLNIPTHLEIKNKLKDDLIKLEK